MISLYIYLNIFVIKYPNSTFVIKIFWIGLNIKIVNQKYMSLTQNTKYRVQNKKQDYIVSDLQKRPVNLEHLENEIHFPYH